ncbi:hypothetical protein GUJ93_ZPchr0005g16203 [Zizania palustris]|uniref:NAC-A/B domain-containing protein n=1 Tax=Zizania palustris TaxID=103762 RepID=A0A8J5VHG9_ZIZPA|nr:hypothetical protein GUJ93_ZPchr0005g16203 [Zizania palustris]
MTAAELEKQEEQLRAQIEEQKLGEGDEPVVEDDDDDDDDDDEDDKDEDDVEGVDASGRSKQSRSEKKSRKAMLKLGMKAILGVSRVYCQEEQEYPFVISRPDVFKSPTSDTYVILGRPRLGLSSQLQTQVPEQFKAPDLSSMLSKPEASTAAQDEDETVDETGVEPKDIELEGSGVQTSLLMAASTADSGLRAWTSKVAYQKRPLLAVGTGRHPLVHAGRSQGSDS